jgi:hypothetical protein
MPIRSLAVVIALSLFCTSANALTMEECRAKYKAAMKTYKGGVGIHWTTYQEKECGISANAAEPKSAPAAPVKH